MQGGKQAVFIVTEDIHLCCYSLACGKDNGGKGTNCATDRTTYLHCMHLPLSKNITRPGLEFVLVMRSGPFFYIG